MLLPVLVSHAKTIDPLVVVERKGVQTVLFRFRAELRVREFVFLSLQGLDHEVIRYSRLDDSVLLIFMEPGQNTLPAAH
jgi:hypothetical protein